MRMPNRTCRYRAPSALSALSRGEELVANAEAELSRHDAGAEMLADAAESASLPRPPQVGMRISRTMAPRIESGGDR